VINKLKYISITLLTIICQQGFSQNWLPLNHGLGCDSSGSSLIYNIYADNEEGKIYVSGNLILTENGEFENCESETSGAAVWNGNRFTNLNGGRYFHQGFEIVKYKNIIYQSAPIFSTINQSHYFSRWNGVTWDSLVGAPNSRVRTSKIIDGELWLGGWFTECGNQNSPMLGKFDGENFFPVNTEFTMQSENYIGGMDFLNDTLYVAGDFGNFSQFGGTDDTVSTFAKFYGNRLHGVKPYFTNASASTNNCLVNYKNELYIGGPLNFVGEDTIHYLLKYDGKRFSSVGPPDMKLNQTPTCMKVYRDELYILGIFNKLGDQNAQQLIKWDGNKYTILNTDTIFSKTGYPATGLTATGFDILNDTLYIAGSFYRIANDTMRCIAKLNRALSDPIPPPAENSLTLYPNPSSNEVTIGYSLSSLQNVDFGIYDIRGRLIRKIEKGKKQAGKYVLKVDISNLANGIYILQMRTGDDAIFKKLLKE
jgi:Secretion system C-terminal sorting domain